MFRPLSIKVHYQIVVFMWRLEFDHYIEAQCVLLSKRQCSEHTLWLQVHTVLQQSCRVITLACV